MIKGFLILTIALVTFDMTLRHGVGTSATIGFFERAVHTTIAVGRDSVFSH